MTEETVRAFAERITTDDGVVIIVVSWYYDYSASASLRLQLWGGCHVR